jgi:hypothetical protein
MSRKKSISFGSGPGVSLVEHEDAVWFGDPHREHLFGFDGFRC